MKDPYKILGINQSATKEEIKKAYRKLAKEYHPDKHVNNPLAELAEAKFREIQEAYETLMRGQNQYQSTGTSSSSYQSNASSSQSYQGAGSNIQFAAIRSYIKNGRYQDAYQMLQAARDGSAEWNFLNGITLINLGNYIEGQRFMQVAMQQDPHNQEYREYYNKVNQRQSAYSQKSYNYGRGASPMGCCCDLLCADACCECLGGDLITCC